MIDYPKLLAKLKQLDATHVSCRVTYSDYSPRFFRQDDFGFWWGVSDVATVKLYELPLATQSVYDIQTIVDQQKRIAELESELQNTSTQSQWVSGPIELGVKVLVYHEGVGVPNDISEELRTVAERWGKDNPYKFATPYKTAFCGIKWIVESSYSGIPYIVDDIKEWLPLSPKVGE